jgi:uncharacterized protein (TIGR02300 family)
MASDAAFLTEQCVAKADLGDKQLCPNCGAKFYDLGRRPATCPKCHTAFDPQDEAIRLKRVRGRPASYDDDEAKPEEAEEEAPEALEIDEAAAEAPVEDLDADEEGPANSDEIPAGFSEDVGEDAEADVADDDDVVPIIDDEEDKFPEGEIEIGNDDEKEPS